MADKDDNVDNVDNKVEIFLETNSENGAKLIKDHVTKTNSDKPDDPQIGVGEPTAGKNPGSLISLTFKDAAQANAFLKTAETLASKSDNPLDPANIEIQNKEKQKLATLDSVKNGDIDFKKKPEDTKKDKDEKNWLQKKWEKYRPDVQDINQSDSPAEVLWKLFIAFFRLQVMLISLGYRGNRALGRQVKKLEELIKEKMEIKPDNKNKQNKDNDKPQDSNKNDSNRPGAPGDGEQAQGRTAEGDKPAAEEHTDQAAVQESTAEELTTDQAASSRQDASAARQEPAVKRDEQAARPESREQAVSPERPKPAVSPDSQRPGTKSRESQKAEQAVSPERPKPAVSPDSQRPGTKSRESQKAEQAVSPERPKPALSPDRQRPARSQEQTNKLRGQLHNIRSEMLKRAPEVPMRKLENDDDHPLKAPNESLEARLRKVNREYEQANPTTNVEDRTNDLNSSADASSAQSDKEVLDVNNSDENANMQPVEDSNGIDQKGNPFSSDDYDDDLDTDAVELKEFELTAPNGSDEDSNFKMIPASGKETIEEETAEEKAVEVKQNAEINNP